MIHSLFRVDSALEAIGVAPRQVVAVRDHAGKTPWYVYREPGASPALGYRSWQTDPARRGLW